MKNLFGEEIEIVKEEEEKKKSFLFEFINDMFSKQKDFDKKPSFEKAKNFFMLQRFFAIKYPLVSNAFNILNINEGAAIDCWAQMLRKIYNVQPPWIVNTLKSMKIANNAKKKNSFSEEAIEMFCKKNMMSRKDFETMLQYCPEKTVEELGQYEMYLNYDITKKKIK